MANSEPKEVVRQFLAAIKGGDGQTMMSLLAVDAVVVLPGSFKVAWAGRWQGREPIKQCFQAIGALLDIRDHTVQLMFGEGEHVIVLIDETSAPRTPAGSSTRRRPGISVSRTELLLIGRRSKTPSKSHGCGTRANDRLRRPQKAQEEEEDRMSEPPADAPGQVTLARAVAALAETPAGGRPYAELIARGLSGSVSTRRAVRTLSSLTIRTRSMWS